MLRTVVEEMQLDPEEWSSFIDRKSGEVVGLPDDALAFIQNGGDPDDGFCGVGDIYLGLAQKICDSDDFVPLLNRFDIHEWAIMRDFCETRERDANRQELLEAVHGDGALRQFKSAIDRLGILHEWRCFKDRKLAMIAIKWLDENSIWWIRKE